MAKPTGDVFCCRYCGRDTRAQDEICGHCRGGSRWADRCHHEEWIGRHTCGTSYKASPFDDPPDPPPTDFQYHGDSVRDDL